MKKLATTVAMTAILSTMVTGDVNAGIISRNNTVTARNLQAAFGGNIAIAKNWKSTESKKLYDAFVIAQKKFKGKLSTFRKTDAEKTFKELLNLLEKALKDIYQCEDEKTLTKKTTNLVSYWTQKYDTKASINSVQNVPDYDSGNFSSVTDLLSNEKFEGFIESFSLLELPEQFWTKTGAPVVEGTKKTFGIILALQCLMGKDDPRKVISYPAEPSVSPAKPSVSPAEQTQSGNWMFNQAANNPAVQPTPAQQQAAAAIQSANTGTVITQAQAPSQQGIQQAPLPQGAQQAPNQLSAQQPAAPIGQTEDVVAAIQQSVQSANVAMQSANVAIQNAQQMIQQSNQALASRQYAMAESYAQQAVQQASVAERDSQNAVQQANASQQQVLIQQAGGVQQSAKKTAQQASANQASVTAAIQRLSGRFARMYQQQKAQLQSQ